MRSRTRVTWGVLFGGDHPSMMALLRDAHMAEEAGAGAAGHGDRAVRPRVAGRGRTQISLIR